MSELANLPGGETKTAACPFCSLACEDLEVTVQAQQIKVTAGGCRISTPMFEDVTILDPSAPAWVGGRPAPLASAIASAAEILQHAAKPLIGGLGTDVAGMRAALALARQIGAQVDHMHGHTAFRNIRVLQDSGWIGTTLGEVRNRADLVLLIGGPIQNRYPRFFERCIEPTPVLARSGTSSREVIGIGSFAPEAGISQVYQCPNDQLGEVFAALRAILAGRTLQVQQVGGIDIATLQNLAARLHQANYGVAVWSAADFDFPNADLTIQCICELVNDLNVHTRFAVLPMAPPDQEATARQVMTWQTGYPGHINCAQPVPRYDPDRSTLPALVAQHEIDALLWISSFDKDQAPPKTGKPTIVLGRSGMKAADADVFIPVAIPGIEQPGHLFRGDHVIVLRFPQLVATGRPAAADVLAALTEAIQHSQEQQPSCG